MKSESKKSTSVKSIKELPKSFNLKNYDQAKKLNAEEWYDELMSRLYLNFL